MSRFERLLSSYASVASRLKRGQSTRQIRYYESERLCRTRHLEEVQACASICEQRRILDKNTLFCAKFQGVALRASQTGHCICRSPVQVPQIRKPGLGRLIPLNEGERRRGKH